MALSFPNSARSYDETKQRVRFVGHDGMFEIRFFAPVEILATGLSSRTAREADYLDAFDKMRPHLLDVAQKAYAASRSNSITLDPQNFR